jgi:hypothetical protein
VIDMFEPQDHPNDMDERGIPRRPYDNAGYTLAYQMGVIFDRVFDDVTGPLAEVQGLAKPVPGAITGTASAGYLISPAINDGFTVVNRVIKANGEAYRLGVPMSANGRTYPAGSFYVTASATTTPIVQKAAQELGVNVDATADRPARSATKLAARRIALWDTQTGSMPSGWTRFLLERFEFPFTRVRAGFDDTAPAEVRRDHPAFSGGFRPGRRWPWWWRRWRWQASATPAAAPKDPDLRSLCEVNTAPDRATLKRMSAGSSKPAVVIAAGSAAESTPPRCSCR